MRTDRPWQPNSRRHFRRAGLALGCAALLVACSDGATNGPNGNGSRADAGGNDSISTTGKTLSFAIVELDAEHAGTHAQIARAGGKMGIAYLRRVTDAMRAANPEEYKITCPRGGENQDSAAHELYYFPHDGTDWTAPVDASARIIGVPAGISLALDESNNVHIGHLGGELGFFVCNSSDAAVTSSTDGGQSWSTSVLFGGGANSVADTAGHWTSVALDCGGNVQASFREIGLGGFQAEVDFASSVWVYGEGTAITSRMVFGENLAGLGDGEFNRLLFGSDCEPVALSYDSDPGVIKVAARQGDTWIATDVARGPTAEYPGFATDGNGTFGMAYSGGDQTLRVREATDPQTWGEPEIVDRSPTRHGNFASMAYDSQGNPAVAYYRCATSAGATDCKATEDALMLAYRRNGVWKTWEVDTGNEWFCGRYTSLMFTVDDRPFIAYECTYFANQTEVPSMLKVAEGEWN